MTDSTSRTRDIRGISTSKDVKGVITSRLMQAVDVSLLARSLNKYFRTGHTTTMTDAAPTFVFNKTADTDSVQLTEAISDVNFSKALPEDGETELFTLSDTPAVAVDYVRNFTDAFTMDDNATVDAFVKDFFGAKTNVFSFADTQAFGVGKGLADSFTLGEAPAVSFAKGETDTFTMSQVFSRVVAYERSFTDSQSMAEAISSFDVGKGLTDSTTMTEAPAVSFAKAATDSTSMTDAPAQEVGLGKTDSFTFSDVDSRVVTFVRSFTDAFTMDDAATVDAFVKDYGGSKTNVFSFSDSETIGVGKGLTDNFSLGEAIDSVVVGKGLTDSVTVTENFSFALFSNAAFNAAPLNQAPFNE